MKKISDDDNTYITNDTYKNIIPRLDSKEVQNPQSAVMYSRSLMEKLDKGKEKENEGDNQSIIIIIIITIIIIIITMLLIIIKFTHPTTTT